MRFKRPKAEKRAEVAEKQLLALDLSLSLSLVLCVIAVIIITTILPFAAKVWPQATADC